MPTRYDLDMELINAAGEGHLDRIGELLRSGANPNARHVIHRGTPLQAAAAAGHLDVARLLVQHGADVNLAAGDAPQVPLESAAVAGRADVVDWLLQSGARVPPGCAAEELLTELTKLGEHGIVASLQKGLERQRTEAPANQA